MTPVLPPLSPSPRAPPHCRLPPPPRRQESAFLLPSRAATAFGLHAREVSGSTAPSAPVNDRFLPQVSVVGRNYGPRPEPVNQVCQTTSSRSRVSGTIPPDPMLPCNTCKVWSLRRAAALPRPRNSHAAIRLPRLHAADGPCTRPRPATARHKGVYPDGRTPISPQPFVTGHHRPRRRQDRSGRACRGASPAGHRRRRSINCAPFRETRTTVPGGSARISFLKESGLPPPVRALRHRIGDRVFQLTLTTSPSVGPISP